jgi:hypothetical protein
MGRQRYSSLAAKNLILRQFLPVINLSLLSTLSRNLVCPGSREFTPVTTDWAKRPRKAFFARRFRMTL